MVGSMQKESTKKREAYFIDFIAKVRDLVTTPLMLTGGFRTLKGMQEALDSKAVDIIGLGRPFCMYPYIAKELLSGSREDCICPGFQTGVEKIDMSGMLVTPWYMFQLHRIGQGLAPDPNMDPWMVYEKVTGKSRPVT